MKHTREVQQEQNRLRVVFDGNVTIHYSGQELIEWNLEVHEYKNGMSQVIGKTQDIMLLIGALAETSVGVVDVIALKGEN